MSKILIIDDEKDIRDMFHDIFPKDEIVEAAKAKDALRLLNSNDVDMAFCDIKLNDSLDGIDILTEVKRRNLLTPIVMITGHGDIPVAVEAMKKGAYDFLLKPLDLESLRKIAKKAIEFRSLSAENKKLTEENKTLRRELNSKVELTGHCEAMKELKNKIDAVAPTPMSVLILGENGTGKEVVARRIHQLSRRANKKMVEVNCAAIPKDLIESELFGHKKGSFTGATTDKEGLFQAADGGTIFLDEIGDMSLEAQADILRVLQERKVKRVGDNNEQEIDVRVIAATNKNLEEEIKKGSFRQDLLYRLNKITLRIPPLRERVEDIEDFINTLLPQSAKEMGKPVPSFTPEAIEELRRHPWNGNIRELQNVIDRIVIYSTDNIITADFVRSNLKD